MSAQVESESALVPDGQPETAAVGGSLATMFDAHAAHLFDYCFSRLNDDEQAAQATKATFVIAHVLENRIWNRARIRAWLFALARVECAARESGRAEIVRAGYAVQVAGPEDNAGPATERLQFADIEAYGSAPERALAAAFAALPDPDREVLDLVYRHDVSAAELPAVLGISAELARTVLAADVLRFQPPAEAGTDSMGWQVPDPDELALRAGAERLSELPLAGLPGSVWPGIVTVATDPELCSAWDSSRRP